MENKLEEVENNKVILSMSENQFNDFIQSLLGKPQTISKDYRGYYKVEKKDIINLNKILDQRISQQNKGKLVNFSTSIYYNDNSTIELNGIDHFINYIETLPLICEALHLTWKFLVKFEDKDSPELQEINISFITDNSFNKKYDFQDNSANGFYYSSSPINLRIKHTARTWGVDIEGLLSRHINKIIKKNSKIVKYFNFRYSSDEFIFINLIMFITSSILLNNILIKGNIDIEKGVTGILFLISLYFILRIIKNIWDNFILGSISKDSYILLNDESIKNMEEQEKKYKNSWYKLTLYIITQILISIVGNYLFNNYF